MRRTSYPYVRRPRTRAMATVELALVLPVLLLLLFGILEFGLLFKDALLLQQACREAARAAAVGATPSQIEDTVTAAAPTLNSDNMEVTSEYRTWEGSGWSKWMDLGTASDGSSNDAPAGSQIRVSVTYLHPLITGGLFSWMATEPNENAVELSSRAVCRRE